MVIYKATNLINGKVYIGQTRQKFLTRKYQHITSSRSKKKGNYFSNAMRKHGSESFEWEIIDYADSIQDLNEKEKKWISFYNSTNNKYGYNLESGGNCRITIHESTRKKLSISAKKRGISPDILKKMQTTRRKNNKPIPHTKEWNSNISKGNKGKIRTPEMREKNRIGSTGKHPSIETRLKLSLCQQGEKCYAAKITEKQAYRILERLKNGEFQADLAREYGVTDSAIYRLKKGKSWKHLKR